MRFRLSNRIHTGCYRYIVKDTSPYVYSRVDVTFSSLSFSSQVTVKCSDGQDVVLNWSRVRSFDKEVASMFLSHVKEHDRAT